MDALALGRPILVHVVHVVGVPGPKVRDGAAGREQDDDGRKADGRADGGRRVDADAEDGVVERKETDVEEDDGGFEGPDGEGVDDGQDVEDLYVCV